MSITKGEGTSVLLSLENSGSVVWPEGFDMYKVSVVNSVLEDTFLREAEYDQGLQLT